MDVQPMLHAQQAIIQGLRRTLFYICGPTNHKLWRDHSHNPPAGVGAWTGNQC